MTNEIQCESIEKYKGGTLHHEKASYSIPRIVNGNCSDAHKYCRGNTDGYHHRAWR